MSDTQIPKSDNPRVIIIGGGFAGIQLAKKLRNLPLQIVMFDRNNYHTFQPLLYQVATSALEPDSIADPLRKQLEPKNNFYFRMGAVHEIDAENNRLSTEIGEIGYDYLVIATGSRTNYYGNDSIRDNGLAIKQIPQALDMRSHILQNFEAANITEDQEEKISRMNVVIVGGGPTGVELAGAMGELRKNVLPRDYPELDFSQMKIILAQAEDRLLPAMSEKSSERALKYLKKFGVDVRLETMVKTYNDNTAYLNTGDEIRTHTLIWAAGVKGTFPDGLNVKSIANDRILVDRYNCVEGYDNIFAIGDIASMKSEDYPRGHPMVAPVAMQQGRHLAKNFKNLLNKKPLEPFEYEDKGTMATIGRNKAVADIGKLRFGGFLAWLIWMFVHLLSIVGFRNRLIVFSNWVWNYFTYDKGTRLIIRKFDRKNKIQEDVVA
ncbi:MAG: NAD(P)/FAD-dependent oxidoreductase [Fulvivirga sp.]|nr:NAD(P)/FAD-dependent oxidoreductase [Fulvivirga sp.]